MTEKTNIRMDGRNTFLPVNNAEAAEVFRHAVLRPKDRNIVWLNAFHDRAFSDRVWRLNEILGDIVDARDACTVAGSKGMEYVDLTGKLDSQLTADIKDLIAKAEANPGIKYFVEIDDAHALETFALEWLNSSNPPGFKVDYIGNPDAVNGKWKTAVNNIKHNEQNRSNPND